MKDNNIYVRSYFRIEVGYVWGKGMDDIPYKNFTDEIKKIFTSLGFTFKPGESLGYSPDVVRGAESLYCHPMDLVGYVKKDTIKEVEKVLKEAKTFKFRKTDTYEEVLNYTPEELKTILEDLKSSIEYSILDLFKTKRKNLYKSISSLWDFETLIKFFRDNLELKTIERVFINSTFENLRITGKIKESSNPKVGKIYRTVTK